MLDTHLIAKRFSSKSKNYSTHAVFQKRMAKELINLCFASIQHLQNSKNGLSLLELGCGDGLFTKELSRLENVKHYFANDLYECENTMKSYFPHSDVTFLQCDARKLCLQEKIDIIASNAFLQWIEEPHIFLRKITNFLNPHGIMAFSTFTKGNFSQIKSTTNQSLHYYDVDELVEKFSPFLRILHKKTLTQTLHFSSPIEVLKHIKNTGVNGISKQVWHKKQLHEFCKKYEKFRTKDGYALSYHGWMFTATLIDARKKIVLNKGLIR